VVSLHVVLWLTSGFFWGMSLYQKTDKLEQAWSFFAGKPLWGRERGLVFEA
jgi:hypothetical protein